MDLPVNCIADITNFINNTPEWNNYRRFGGDGRNVRGRARIYCCKRLRIPSKTKRNVLRDYRINWGGDSLLAYQARFLVYNRRTPRRRKQISHICGVPEPNGYTVCIVESHMTDDTKRDNDKRMTCHSFIRHYELRHRRDGQRQRGPIFVKDVPSTDKRIIAKKVMGIYKQNELDGVKGAQYVCPHINNPCFINYSELSHNHVD